MHSGEEEPSSAAALQLSLKHTASSAQQRAWTRRLFGHGWAAKEACGSIMASRLLQGSRNKEATFLDPAVGRRRSPSRSQRICRFWRRHTWISPDRVEEIGLVSRGEGCQSPSQGAWRDVEWT